MTKSIVEKLNLQKYKRAAVLNLPPETGDLAGLTYDSELTKSKYDLIFAFVLDMDALKATVSTVIEEDRLEQGGYLYLAYPKKGNKKYSTFIHRDDLLDGLDADEDGYVGTSPIKFSRMVGMDEVFTVVGLKKDARNRNRSQSPSRASQRVDDYEALVPEVEQDLQDAPDLLAFYRSLTPGYRKDWARYVYSAKQESTRAKRREEMKAILGAGYKSRELYRRDEG
ncbi:YdeI/OmpD-associated family protein [Paenibacillus sp. FSL R5-0407]|uniref:YdeI/OmpD-associated family protein n=1 Tax=Paenibacillus sp. FSL R5-0407 TaxID=2975320 RepID=UPI0030F506FE